MSSLRRARAISLLVGVWLALAPAVRAGKTVFQVKNSEGRAFTVWRITHAPWLRDHANYYSIQCWSPDGRYLCYTRRAPRIKGGPGGAPPTAYSGVYVYDVQQDRTLHIDPNGSSPRWANTRNWLFYIDTNAGPGRPPQNMKGHAVMRVDMDTGRRDRICYGLAAIGGLSYDDKWLYGILRIREARRKPYKGFPHEFPVVRSRTEPGSEWEDMKRPRGRRPIPNPARPIITQVTGGGKIWTATVVEEWFDMDGRNTRTGFTYMNVGHKCWTGDGVWRAIGDCQIRGRRWDRPYPSPTPHLANATAGDISPASRGGRFVCGTTKLVDLRCGDAYPSFPVHSHFVVSKGGRGFEGEADPDAKGSPDGTKICFVTNYDIKDGPATRLTKGFGKNETKRLDVESAEGFPEQGEIDVRGEVLSYSRKTPAAFLDLKRRLYNTPTRYGMRRGHVVTAFKHRLMTDEERRLRGVSPAKYLEPDLTTPVAWQRQTDVYVAVVRRPDPPCLRLRGGRLELIPGENHYETRAYRLERDGQRIPAPLLVPGASLRLQAPGAYTARAVERSALESPPSRPARLTRPTLLTVLKEKPGDFSWTEERWSVNGVAADKAKALKGPTAEKRTVHLADGVIRVETYAKGVLIRRDDLNRNGQATRRVFYKNGVRARREYWVYHPHYTGGAARRSLEIFGPKGHLRESASWRFDAKGKPVRNRERWVYDANGQAVQYLRGRTLFTFKNGKWSRK